uniref:FtsX-like permease family protein n=1 Tax=Nonomuraea bangladeshensis TaxID=404385 RepID=UPI003F4917C5
MSVDLGICIAVFAGLFFMAVAAGISGTSISASHGRRELTNRRIVVLGLFTSFSGVCLMALGAWLAQEDSRYDVWEILGILLLTLAGAGLLAAGLVPLPPWLVEIIGPYAERLPPPARLVVRDLGRRRAGAALAVPLAMTATAFGLALTVVAVGLAAQNRAEYRPSARPGTLLVRAGSAAEAATVRATIARELPGVPIAQRETVADSSRLFGVEAADVEASEKAFYGEAIGDENLLRYLTGDRSTPYDEGTAVVVTSADVKVDSVTLTYEIDKDDENTKTIPAIVAKPSDPHMETIFLPSTIVRELGYQLRPIELIVDPTLYRVTAEDQRRLDDRLDDAVAEIYVERGFEAPLGWLPVAAAAFLIAVFCALTSGFGPDANTRQARVMRRAGDDFRWFCASRAGLSALCATVLGAVVGCPAGMFLLWPLTISGSWEEPVRPPFETPWPAITAVVVGLPLLAAAVAAIFAREHPHVLGPRPLTTAGR